jgi:hypothetical protein
MYLVSMIDNNNVTVAKGFNQWDNAVDYADTLVMDVNGVSNDMPDWENSTVYVHSTGVKVTISYVAI